jgi:hypothetical protein
MKIGGEALNIPYFENIKLNGQLHTIPNLTCGKQPSLSTGAPQSQYEQDEEKNPPIPGTKP